MSARLTLATRVTLLRILGIPVFVLLMVYYEIGLERGAPQELLRVAALGTFVLVALTDALDGYLARSRNEITHLGRILDPLADKLLLVSALLVLTRPSLPELHPQVPVWFTLVIVSRDVLLVAGAFVVRYFAATVHVQPHWTGKASTALQMLAVTWVLADGPAGPFPAICIAAAVLALVAGGFYLAAGIRQLEHTPAHEG